MPQLHKLATYYTANGGALWVAEAGGTVAGMIATQPLEGAIWEICQVYVDPALHGSGLGPCPARHGRAARHCGRRRTAGAMERHTLRPRAPLLRKAGPTSGNGAVRVLNDISNSLEFGYAKPVNGIEPLDIAAATSAAGRLAEILIACVDHDASVSFLPPLAHEKAKAFWQKIASEIGVGKRFVVAAWRDGVLVGTGTLVLAMPENQQHRCEVQKILVDPSITAKRPRAPNSEEVGE